MNHVNVAFILLFPRDISKFFGQLWGQLWLDILAYGGMEVVVYGVTLEVRLHLMMVKGRRWR